MMNNPYHSLDKELRKIRKDGYSSSFMKRLQSKKCIEEFYSQISLSAASYDTRLWTLRGYKEHKTNFTLPVVTSIVLGIVSLICSVFFNISQFHAIFVRFMGGSFLLDSEDYAMVLEMRMSRVYIFVLFFSILIIYFYVLAVLILNQVNCWLHNNDYQLEMEIAILEKIIASIYENSEDYLSEEILKKTERERKYRKFLKMVFPFVAVFIVGRIFIAIYQSLMIRDLLAAVLGIFFFIGVASLWRLREKIWFQKKKEQSYTDEEKKE